MNRAGTGAPAPGKGVSVRRRLVQVLAVCLSVVGVLALTVVPASARKPKVPHFSGGAAGWVHCSMVVKVVFHPRMTNKSADVKNFRVSLKNCDSHGGAGQTITKGRVKDKSLSSAASFTQSVLNCTDPPPPSQSTLNILWKGTYTATISGIHFSGRAQFFPSNVEFNSETEVTGPHGVVGVTLPGTGGSGGSEGSFPHNPPNGASATLYTPYTTSQLSAMCAGKGLGKMVYTGSITVGL